MLAKLIVAVSVTVSALRVLSDLQFAFQCLRFLVSALVVAALSSCGSAPKALTPPQEMAVRAPDVVADLPASHDHTPG